MVQMRFTHVIGPNNRDAIDSTIDGFRQVGEADWQNE
jgi:hypothetical protein